MLSGDSFQLITIILSLVSTWHLIITNAWHETEGVSFPLDLINEIFIVLRLFSFMVSLKANWTPAWLTLLLWLFIMEVACAFTRSSFPENVPYLDRFGWKTISMGVLCYINTNPTSVYYNWLNILSMTFQQIALNCQAFITFITLQLDTSISCLDTHI